MYVFPPVTTLKFFTLGLHITPVFFLVKIPACNGNYWWLINNIRYENVSETSNGENEIHFNGCRYKTLRIRTCV